MKPWTQGKYCMLKAGEALGIHNPRNYRGAKLVIKAAPKDVYLPGTVPVASPPPAPREGLQAYLERQARESRKSVDPEFFECDTCSGTGETMIAVYEGGCHREKDGPCPDCGGDGIIYPIAAIAEKLIEKTVEQLGDGWIEWGGGECPVEEGTLVDVKHGDVGIYFNQKSECKYSCAESWNHLMGFNGGNIIAYRLTKSK